MADAIDIVIRARDDASAALRATQGALDDVARAERELKAAEQARAAADAAAASGSDDAATALRRQRDAADAAAAAARRLADAEAAAAAAAERLRRSGGAGGGGPMPPGGGGGGGAGAGGDGRLDAILSALSRDLGGFGDQIKALIPALTKLNTATTTTAAAIAAAGGRLGRGGGPVPPVPPRPPPGPNPPPGPGPNPPPPPGGGRDAQARQTLIANLMDVTTQLAGGANPMLILIQQGPALAAAIASASSAGALFSGILASMKAALIAASAVIAPLLIGLAAAGTAYLVAKNATEEANEAQGVYNVNVADAEAKLAAMADRLDEVNGMLAKVKDRTKENAREIAVLTGEITKEEASRQKAVETVQEQAKAETDAARERLRAQMDLVHVQENALKLEEKRSSGIIGKDAREELRENIRVGKEQVEMLKQDLSARQAATAKELEQIDTLAKLREAQGAEAGARKRSTAAVRQQVEALTELQAALRAALPTLKEALAEAKLLDGALAEGGDIVPPNFIDASAIGKARELGDALNSLAPSKSVLSDLEKLQMLLLDIQRANINSGGRLGGLEVDANAAVSAAQDDAAAKAGADIDAVLTDFSNVMTAMSDAAMQRAAGVGSQIGAVIGGDISGALTSVLSAAGPVGAAVGGMISGLSALGEQGAGQTSKMITGFLQSIIKGLSSLPALLVKLIPSLIVDVLPDLVVALVGAIPRLVVAIVIELPVAIVRGVTKWWRDMGGLKGIAKSIAEGVRDWWQGTWDRIKSWVRDIFRPSQKNEGANSRNLTEGQRETNRNIALYGDPRGGAAQQATEGFDTLTSRNRSNAARAATPAPTIVLQGDFTPDFVPNLGRRLDRYNGPGGLRSGTTILGGN